MIDFGDFPSTSRAARDSIASAKGALQIRVLRAIKASPDGATDEELQVALGMNPSTERPRRGELEKQGLVMDSGRTRKTKSGRNAIVWVAKPSQRTLLF